jgi:hypothetical protein
VDVAIFMVYVLSAIITTANVNGAGAGFAHAHAAEDNLLGLFVFIEVFFSFCEIEKKRSERGYRERVIK